MSNNRLRPALQRMLAANAEWAEEVSAKDPNFFPDLTKGQSPKLLWLGCSDSRVPESVVLRVG
jgi:carbonic anhydrase